MESKPTNDGASAVTKFCLAMEEHRRTPAGRVRTAKDLVAHFFPHDESGPKDRLFHLMPKEVRGPILSGWGIRGTKAALRDDDEKVRSVVYDALVAGDIDDDTFEAGVTPQHLADWVPLSEWWRFWRTGKLTGVAIQKALATARELGLIDDAWFLANLEGRGGKLKGTDAVCDTLSKDQVVKWLRHVHASGDGSPAGLVEAIGWDTILQKTAEDALLFALDAFAKKVGLFVEGPQERKTEPPQSEPRGYQPPKSERSGGGAEPVAHTSPSSTDVPAGPDLSATSEGEVVGTDAAEESPKLAAARAAMLEALNDPAKHPDAGLGSEAPRRPSALDWTESDGNGARSAPPPSDRSSVDIIPIEEDEDDDEAADTGGKPSGPPPLSARKGAAPRPR